MLFPDSLACNLSIVFHREEKKNAKILFAREGFLREHTEASRPSPSGTMSRLRG
jgi:hypothetical protein